MMAKSKSSSTRFSRSSGTPRTGHGTGTPRPGQQDILARTGQSIGVFDASFTVEAGEIFVVMGLSGSGQIHAGAHAQPAHRAPAGRILVDGQDITR